MYVLWCYCWPAMGLRVRAAMLALLAGWPAWIAGCASQGDGGTTGGPGGGDASTHAPQDAQDAHDATEGPSPDALAPGVDADDDAGGDDATAAPDVVLSGKSCKALPDGTPCGPSPDACHDAPVCAAGSCAPAAAKADGTVCAMAPDACHTDGTCSAGTCGAVGSRPDGYNWSAGDATAICCSAAQIHADTNSDCGACGIACNASNGESCSLLGGHYFCRGCAASADCWSRCCSESFSPYSCAASDCAGNCDSTYCPAGTHCVSGGTTSSDYCSY